MNIIRIKINKKFQTLFLDEIYKQYTETKKIIVDGYELSSHQIKRVIDQKYQKDNKLNINETLNHIETLNPIETLSTDEINDFNYDKMNLDVYDESDFEPLKTDNCNINIFSNKYDNSFKINPFYVVNTINQLLYNHYNYFLNHHTKLNNIVINNLTPISTNTKINSKKNL